MRAGGVFSKIKKSPKYFYIIHYSSESLFGEEKNVKSPRITSVAVMLRIPTHSATHSDHIRPPVPKYSATCDAMP